jgi:hypothetical protein
MDTKCSNQVFYVRFVDLPTVCAKLGLETRLSQIMVFVYASSTWSIVELKKRFKTWISGNEVNGVSMFHLSYLITLKVFLCSQRAPNVRILYFMFDWSIYRLFALNRGWKLDSLQIMILEYVCSTCSVVELRTRFEIEKHEIT